MKSEDWIVVFKHDYYSKIFNKPGQSDDVFAWIRRFEDGRTFRPTTTNNVYQLRSFEFYDSVFEKMHLAVESDSWKCVSLNELSLTYFGSYCTCIIQDKNKISKDVKIHGRYSSLSRHSNISIDDHLYVKAILLFLEVLSDYDDWNDLNARNSALYQEITNSNGIPQAIFAKADA